MPNKMERFTHSARQTLSYAQEEAEQFNHEEISTDHLLLGALRAEGSLAYRILAVLGIELEPLREMVKKYNKTIREDEQLDLSATVKKTLEEAVNEARTLGHHYIGTEHLLLGIATLSESRAKDMLRRNDVRVEDIRKQVFKRLLQQSEEVQATKEPPTEATDPKRVMLDWTAPTEYTFYGNQSMPTTKYVGQLITQAEQLRAKHQHRAILPEHLVVGMLAANGLGRMVLDSFSITGELCEEIIIEMLADFLITDGDPDAYANQLAPEAEAILQDALNVQNDYNHQLTNTAHVLMALLRNPTPAINRILAQHSVTVGMMMNRLGMILSMERL